MSKPGRTSPAILRASSRRGRDRHEPTRRSLPQYVRAGACRRGNHRRGGRIVRALAIDVSSTHHGLPARLAADLGFADQAHLARVVRRELGATSVAVAGAARYQVAELACYDLAGSERANETPRLTQVES